MHKSDFIHEFYSNFGHEPTEHQSLLIQRLVEFVAVIEKNQLFLLKGYAGTGKTSILGALVKTLVKNKFRCKLLAPTGRAAKVLSQKSNQLAFTIHKQIYRKQAATDGAIRLSLNSNLHKNTTFIVDEASMIGDFSMQKDGSISERNLLEDLMEYVFSGEGCKLILLGDEGQLPPVGCDHSPALNKVYLENHFFNLKIEEFQLTEVLRQSKKSSILENATRLRSKMDEGYPTFILQKKGDLIRINGGELQEYLESSMDNYGMDETIVITRSNKWANNYNNQIRSRILWYEDILCNNDCLMVVKNNYFWLDDTSNVGFIANGEMIKVSRIIKQEERYGFEFVRALIDFVDYPDVTDLEVLMFKESLNVESPNISRERLKELFFRIEEDYLHEKNKRKRYDLILKNSYFNALQIKYAYAVTCHKSQGGQWASVFIDAGYMTEEMMNQDYFRWLYTALTRATERVYLVNFADEYFV
ncbi:MAG: AAA family ATPase [Flavobacteriia bacterium]|nr:AAA family ATPase [Flavobacteriia bacterium]